MWVRVSLSMLAAGVLAPVLMIGLCSSGQASCGDWLANDGGGRHSLAANTIADGDAEPSTANASGPVRDPRRAPCHGPHCRQTPPQPPLPTPSGTTSSIEKTMLSSVANSCDDFNPRASVLVSSCVHPLAGYLTTPEHPPRVS